MNHFVIATNADLRLEAFFLNDQGQVMHAWQYRDTDIQLWSPPGPLYGTTDNPNCFALVARMTHLSVSTNLNGQIQVIAVSRNGQMYLCRQVAFQNWEGWFKLETDRSYEPPLTAQW